MRNVLTHLYDEIDDERVIAAVEPAVADKVKQQRAQIEQHRAKLRRQQEQLHRQKQALAQLLAIKERLSFDESSEKDDQDQQQHIHHQ